MAYRIEFTPRAGRQFKHLDRSIQNRLVRRIDSLAENPRPQGVKKLRDGDNLYRLRVGDYRVIYQIQQKKLIVLVIAVGHRAEVYRRRN